MNYRWNMLQYQEDRYIFSDLFPAINMPENERFHRQGNQSPRYACQQCGSTYKQKTHLTRHVKHECGKEPQFCCPACPKRYKQKNTLRLHIYKHHY
ncbi:hypothetical protein C0J52_13330 [Blattella germanica]|nr:hypothetical protein C0J52_13330 [Blattella germanica]